MGSKYAQRSIRYAFYGVFSFPTIYAPHTRTHTRELPTHGNIYAFLIQSTTFIINDIELFTKLVHTLPNQSTAWIPPKKKPTWLRRNICTLAYFDNLRKWSFESIHLKVATRKPVDKMWLTIFKWSLKEDEDDEGGRNVLVRDAFGFLMNPRAEKKNARYTCRFCLFFVVRYSCDKNIVNNCFFFLRRAVARVLVNQWHFTIFGCNAIVRHIENHTNQAWRRIYSSQWFTNCFT